MHDPGWRQAAGQQGCHGLHGFLNMFEKGFLPFTEMIQVGHSVLCECGSVFGATAPAVAQQFTFAAVWRQMVEFILSESRLPL